MKKNLFFSLTFLCLSVSVVNAQHRFGVSPGLSFATIKITQSLGETDKKAKLGFDGGVFAEFNVSDMLAVQPEINYSMQGVKLTDGSNEAFFRFNYLTIPVLVKVKPVKSLSFFAGPQLGILLSAESEDATGTKNDVKEALEDTDFYAVLGAEYQHTSGFFLGARYNLGLQKIVEEGGEYIKNRYFSVRVGYSMPFKGKVKSK